MEIRKATLHDIPEIVLLLKTSLGEKLMPKSESFFIWKHLKNPFGESKILIAEEENKIIELEEEIKTHPHYKFDKETLENFTRELSKTKEYTFQILNGDTSFTSDETVLTAKSNIREMVLQRPKRIIKRVNYSGMDMNEEDEGYISVCKPHFTKTKNGVKIRYNWERVSLAQANEIGDEDYVDNEQDYIEEEELKIAVTTNTRRSPRNLKRINY
jgi:hypothetical protein